MENLKGRHFLKVMDFTTDELNYLLRLSHNLKAQKYNGIVNKPLTGKSVALMFQKDSTRTRCAFEVGAADLGMHTVYIGPSGSQFHKKESIADTAKVLGRMFDGIEFRGYAHQDVEALAKDANVPVWNGLTDDWHPTQMIADFMTIQENFGMNLKGKKLVYVGDGRNNMANSLMVMGVKMGMTVVVLSPQQLRPEAKLVKECEAIGNATGGAVTLSSNWKEATKGAHVIYTDVWVSMGESNWDERLKLLHEYQVNMAMLKNADPNVIFLHCLPAFHDLNTEISKAKAKEYGTKYPNIKNGALEVSDEVFLSKYSKVFQEAENRLHSIKAIMLATIGQ